MKVVFHQTKRCIFWKDKFVLLDQMSVIYSIDTRETFQVMLGTKALKELFKLSLYINPDLFILIVGILILCLPYYRIVQ